MHLPLLMFNISGGERERSPPLPQMMQSRFLHLKFVQSLQSLLRLSHRRFSLSSSSRELFWFSTRFPFQLPLCSHRPELPLLRHDVTVYVAEFLLNGELTSQQRAGDCVGSMLVLLLIIRSQIKLNNDFSNLILFSRVPWFIVY